MQYLVADVFMLGANAITMDGQIINIDGTGNRVAGSLYGSDRIIVIAGANKLVMNLEAGLERIRFVAAGMNNIKYDQQLPCNQSGSCTDCRSAYRNCNLTCIIHKGPEDTRTFTSSSLARSWDSKNQDRITASTCPKVYPACLPSSHSGRTAGPNPNRSGRGSRPTS